MAKVAVLPVQNYTPDTDGAEWVRTAFNEMVPSRYYRVAPTIPSGPIMAEQ